MTNDLSLQHFRPARHAWKQQILTWVWLIIFWTSAGVTWTLGIYTFALGVGCFSLVCTITILKRTAALAQNEIIFYPGHFTMIQGKRRKNTAYSEVEAIDRVPYTANEEIFVITVRNQQFWFSAEYYDKEALWQTFQHYLPPTVFNPDATEKSTLVQQYLQEIVQAVEANPPLVVQQQKLTETILGWGGVLFCVWMVYISWEVFIIGSAPFIVTGLWLALTILGQGTIEVDQDKIAHITHFGRNEIRWNEMEYVGKKRGNFYVGNATKRFVLPVPTSPAKIDQQAMLWEYVELQVNTRKIEWREIQTWEWWSKNTRVSTSSK